MNRTSPWIALVALVLSGVSASAQPAGAQAEVLFRQGKELMAAGKLAEACAAFDASQNLDPTIATLLNQANCREKNHQLATAWGLFLEAERQTRAAADEATRSLHAVAVEHAANLESRLSTLTIAVPVAARVDGLAVMRNGAAVEIGAFDKPLPIDGGAYEITANATGREAWSTRIEVAVEGDAQTVAVPALTVTPVVTPPPVLPVVPEPPPGPSRRGPLLAGAGALVLIGGAVGFALWGNSTYDRAKDEKQDQARRDSLYDSANTRRYLAEGFAVAGVGCAGLAVWLLLRHRDEPETAVGTRVVASPAGIALVGAF